MNQLFASDALLPTGWARNVLITWDGAGHIIAVAPGATQGTAPVAPVIVGEKLESDPNYGIP